MKDKNMELYCCSFNFIEDLEESDPNRFWFLFFIHLNE